MKKATLYTLDVSMIQELNRKKPRGTRSAFVNAAIRARLDGEWEFQLDDVPRHKLTAVLLNKLQQESNYQDTPLILMLKELLQ